MKHILPGLLFVTLAVASAQDIPQWWIDYGVLDETEPASNKSPVTVGQLKYIAGEAMRHFQDELAGVGGVSQAVYNKVLSFAAPDPQNDYTLANLGQLKNLAQPFYDQLRSLNFPLSYVSHPLGYPWSSTTTDDSNRSPVNLGQVKFVFSFDLALWALLGQVGAPPVARDLNNNNVVDSVEDADQDGLSREEETRLGSSDSSTDSDGDSVADQTDAFPTIPAFRWPRTASVSYVTVELTGWTEANDGYPVAVSEGGHVAFNGVGTISLNSVRRLWSPNDASPWKTISPPPSILRRYYRDAPGSPELYVDRSLLGWEIKGITKTGLLIGQGYYSYHRVGLIWTDPLATPKLIRDSGTSVTVSAQRYDVRNADKIWNDDCVVGAGTFADNTGANFGSCVYVNYADPNAPTTIGWRRRPSARVPLDKSAFPGNLGTWRPWIPTCFP